MRIISAREATQRRTWLIKVWYQTRTHEWRSWAAASLMLRALADVCLEREAVGVLDRFHREIHIHVGPVQMMLLGPFDIEDRLHGRPSNQGNSSNGKTIPALWSQRSRELGLVAETARRLCLKLCSEGAALLGGFGKPVTPSPVVATRMGGNGECNGLSLAFRYRTSLAQANGLPDAARDSRQIVGSESTQHVRDDLFVDGE